jgi:DNA-directed RNA polymerase subunit RPC12/RpoP
VGRASDWLREERRRTLGDWAAFCLRCGHVQRYFAEDEAELPAACPECGGELRVRCPSCGVRIASAFAVACEECDAELRPEQLFGGPIRKPPRAPK